MQISAVKAFSDNYIWVMEKDGQAVVVDPGEAKGVLDHIRNKDLQLAAILLTHEHSDHVGGVKEVLEAYPETPVYGPVETAELASQVVAEGDRFSLLGEVFTVMKTAGHSKEHVSFLGEGVLFCGDALFSGGCGRVFTGDYEAQFEALQQFKSLPEEVTVYAGHEYTQTNLRFAHGERPEDSLIEEALKQVSDKREQGIPTLPSTIGKEKQINLFLQAETVEAFKDLRDKRDHF
ncbi:Hydroxyacylglutathione hydrolase [Alkalibacterium sp. AK22]|uniref:hydroxyacylglutathione hydrolase n=1 Tax=Alkalibacterium sp. AK22 TaxID=1229520 RepID=UPI00044EB605|nr:hydroxyacylglutathione hydrolase [Alkalibacterium sp. AK22]EXJ23122.1 Hydroxyacylglutathione hydrolase [Alkalibacterium sp. AK22]